MSIPVEYKYGAIGVFAGAVLVTMAGFGWAGWTTASKAENAAELQVREAVADALGSVCVDRVRHMSDATSQLEEFKKIDSIYSQAEMVEKSGWATVPGATGPEQVTAVAQACAEQLAAKGS